MRLNTTDFLRKCQHPLLLMTGSIPVALILILNAAPDMLTRMWFFPAAYLLLAWGCILLPGKTRLVGGVIGAILLAGMGVILLPIGKTYPLALLPILYIVLLVVTLPMGSWSRNHELNVSWQVAGVITHILLQMLINGAKREGSNIYDAAQMPLLISFMTYAVLLLLALNRVSLDSAAQSRRTVPTLMRRQNVIVTLLLLVVGVGIAAIPAIGSMLGAVWDYILRGISAVVGMLVALMPQRGGTGDSSGASDDMSFSMGETQQPSAFAVFMEKVITVIAWIALVVALILLGRVVIKKLVKFFKYLWMKLGQYSAAASEDYEDEITSTRDEADTEREGLLARMRRFAPAKDKGSTPNEKVRLRYRQLKQRHAWLRASTARETLPEAAAALYERARYGGQTLTEKDADHFHEETRKV